MQKVGPESEELTGAFHFTPTTAIITVKSLEFHLQPYFPCMSSLLSTSKLLRIPLLTFHKITLELDLCNVGLTPMTEGFSLEIS